MASRTSCFITFNSSRLAAPAPQTCSRSSKEWGTLRRSSAPRSTSAPKRFRIWLSKIRGGNTSSAIARAKNRLKYYTSTNRLSLTSFTLGQSSCKSPIRSKVRSKPFSSANADNTLPLPTAKKRDTNSRSRLSRSKDNEIARITAS